MSETAALYVTQPSAPPTKPSKAERQKGQTARLKEAWEVQLRAVATDYVTEHRFCPGRQFRFDYAWLDLSMAVELDGWGHNNVNRYTSDVEKGNLATGLGWRVYHVTTRMVKDHSGIHLVAQALGRPAPAGLAIKPHKPRKKPVRAIRRESVL